MRNFLCGRGETRFGAALGLEIGGSFTLSDTNAHAIFGSDPPSNAADVAQDEIAILDYARTGWIDTVRGIGAGDDARRKAQELARAGLEPTIGIDAAESWPSLRFNSEATLLERYKFGEHLDFRSDARYAEALRSYRWEQWRSLFPVHENLLLARFNSLFQPSASNKVQPFKRFRGALGSSWTTLPPQLTTQRLDTFIAQRGCAVLELEPAVWSLVGAIDRAGTQRQISLGVMFDDHAIACWSDLASRWHDRQMLVATAGRLLAWLWLRTNLDVRTERETERWIVHLGLREPPLRPLTLAELNGLALTVPKTAPEVAVTVEGINNPLPCRREPDPGWPQHDALYLPWSPLEWPG